MRKNIYFIALFLFVFYSRSFCQANVATLDITKTKDQISKYIYSHFSEHLGNCIYDGLWVGENSSIPNNKGIRKDVAEALREIQIPALRWPGGCFADEYHWRDGIGPKEKRPKMINTNWGGVTEDNSFGTDEFMELCSQLGCQAYITGNLGSGTVQEMSQWVEYLNSDNESPMTELRKTNGHEKSWGATFWGVGNESWGCGGQMKPGYYCDRALNYATFLKNYGNNRLKLIAVGPNSDDYNWTEKLMQELGPRFWGISLHYYTSLNSSATNFKEDEWFDVMKKTLYMEELLNNHSAIMDKYDPYKQVALVVDEWGTWYKVEPGTNPAFLFQQNSLRDALVAGINLNIFNNHCDRVKMTAIAQVVNVLQSVILTKGDKMVLTPTYYVFDMYKVHQGAYLVPTKLNGENYEFSGQSVPALSISSSLDKKGKVHISICNLNAEKKENLRCVLKEYKVLSVKGQILTADKINAYNSFEKPNELSIKEFSHFKLDAGDIVVEMPPHSIVTLEVNGNPEMPDNSTSVKDVEPGLVYSYYKGEWYNLPDFDTLTCLKKGVVKDIIFPEGIAGTNFALVYKGYVKIEKTGMYTFMLSSDDGSRLKIGNQPIIVNDGRHSPIEREGTIYLHNGFYPIELSYFQAGGDENLQLYMQGENAEKKSVSGMLWHPK